jgi:pimeloyl-ACP methyl ester carboxylesterase
MRSEEFTLTSDGLNIAAQAHWPDNAAQAPGLIVLHGFGSCKENHAALAAEAASRGWVAVCFDFRGHGASDGCLDSHTIHDVGAALAWLRAQPGVDPARIAVRGSSMGGYFAIHALRRWPELACGVALNPPDEAGLNRLMRDARDPTTFFGEWRARGEGFPRLMGCDLACWLESSDVYRAAAERAPRPLLLVHCRGDEMVPVEITERLCAEACEPKTCWLLEGGDHRFASHDPEVRARMLDWLAAAL